MKIDIKLNKRTATELYCAGSCYLKPEECEYYTDNFCKDVRDFMARLEAMDITKEVL